MLEDINTSKIDSEKSISSLFINANFNELSVNCNILKTNFFSDSFYFFPITKNNQTFSSLYTRDSSNLTHFFTDKFYNNFIEKRDL